VREIENTMRSVVVLHDGEIVRADMLPVHLSDGAHAPVAARAPETGTPAPTCRAGIRPLWIVEREVIESAIASCDGNIPRAAAFLEISPSTIYRKKQAWEAIDRGA
jgi:DNA-binding NtrC family response regulator